MTNASQEELLKQFDKSYNLLPVAQSIVDNGYFEEEPLYLVRRPDGKFVVIEGNRRLAVVKFLTEPAIRALSFRKDKWDELAKQVRCDLSTIPVVIYSKREDLDALLAFKHVSGVLKWDPIQKARFINDLVERTKFKVSFEELRDDTGSSRTTVCNYYVSYRAYLQLKENDIDVSKLEMTYSLFYTALGNSNIRAFIGIDTRRKTPEQLKDPIPEDKIQSAAEIVEFVHGTAEKNPVIVDSRQIVKLGEIITDKKALEALRDLRDFHYAESLLETEEHVLVDNLRIASRYLDEALKDAHRHSDSVEVSKWVDRCAETLVRIVKTIPTKAEWLKKEIDRSS
jgi:hypothetical protein